MKSSFLIRFSIIFLLMLSIFSVFYAIACYWSNGLDGFQSWYGNSDYIQIPAIANSFLYDHVHFSDWYFSQTPYFFPDLFVSYLIGLFTPNIIINMLVYAIIQSLYFVLIIALVLKLITHNAIRLSFSIAFTLIVFLFSTELIHPFTGKLVTLELFESMPMSSQHFGATVIIFTALYLFIQIYNYKKNYLIPAFFLITVLGIFSDLSVILYFSMPLILTLGIWSILTPDDRKSCIKFIALLMVTTACGYLLTRFAPFNHFRDPHIFHLQNHINDLIKVIVNFIKANLIIALAWVSFTVWATIYLIRNYQASELNFIILFELVTVVACIPTFILIDNNLSQARHGSYLGLRHLQPLILGPILLGIPLLLYKQTKIFELLTRNFIFSNLLCLIILYSLINRPALNLANMLTFYPPSIACMDRNIQQLHLQNGIGHYWQGKAFTQFNHSGIKIAPVLTDMSPHFWVNSKQDFQGDNFDFFIAQSPNPKLSDRFDKQVIVARFGKPTSTFTCPGGYEFYVYNKNTMKGFFANFINHNYVNDNTPS